MQVEGADLFALRAWHLIEYDFGQEKHVLELEPAKLGNEMIKMAAARHLAPPSWNQSKSPVR